ncbi:MAG: hypothetical protein IT457_04425 [Planctomycetes bacterium]|nr:hypothetical protein [Planctomycetota bacterium]
MRLPLVLLLSALAGVLPIPAQSPSAVLFDNGPIVNGPGQGPSGSDLSIMRPPSIAVGVGCTTGSAVVADDFVVTAPFWRIDGLLFEVYQFSSSSSPPPLASVSVEIWLGPPGSPSSQRVFGDPTGNRLVTGGPIGVYRVGQSLLSDTRRAVHQVIARVGTVLPAGHYWVVWHLDSSAGAGSVYSPPITIDGQADTGNAQQALFPYASFNPIRDVGDGGAKGLPFKVLGEVFAPPCFDLDLGNDLALGNTGYARDLMLGFDFALPGGAATVDRINVCANGYLTLGTDPSGCIAQPGIAELLGGAPRILALGTDLWPGLGGVGAVHFKTFSGPSARAVSTWSRAPEAGGGPYGNTVQVQLFPGGSFAINFWDIGNPPGNPVLIGVGAGGGRPDPGETDLSSLPGDSGTESTVYEQFAPAEVVDVEGLRILFTPNGAGGYRRLYLDTCTGASAQANPLGIGCPLPALLYESFASGSFDLQDGGLVFRPRANGGYLVEPCSANCLDPNTGSNLLLADDQLSSARSLGHAFPIPGGGSTNAIEISSNGFVNLQTGTDPDPRCCNPSPALLRSGPARLAALWMDLDPSVRGGVFFRTQATKTVVTWSRLVEKGRSRVLSAQLQLFPDGTIRLGWENALNEAHDALIGLCGTAPAVIPAPIDWSARVPFETGALSGPVQLRARNLPILGTTIAMRGNPIPAGTVAGLVLLGITNISLPLDALGMSGCSLYHPGEFGALPLNLMSGDCFLALPFEPSLAGIGIFAQAVLVAPGINPFGIVSSDALLLRMGLR